MSTFQPKVFETESNLRLHILREKISVFAKEKGFHFLPWGDVRHEPLKSWTFEILNKREKSIARFDLDVLANGTTYVKFTCWEAEGQTLWDGMKAGGVFNYKETEIMDATGNQSEYHQKRMSLVFKWLKRASIWTKGYTLKDFLLEHDAPKGFGNETAFYKYMKIMKDNGDIVKKGRYYEASK